MPSKNFQTSAVGKVKGLEFYRKIFELGLPTLQVPRGGVEAVSPPNIVNVRKCRQNLVIASSKSGNFSKIED